MKLWLILSTLLAIDAKIITKNIIVPSNLQVLDYGESFLNQCNIFSLESHPKNVHQRLAQEILEKGKKMLYLVANLNYFFLNFVLNKRGVLQVHSIIRNDNSWAKEKLRQHSSLQDIKLDWKKFYKVR